MTSASATPEPIPAIDPLDALELAIRSHRDALARTARREGLSPEDAIDCVHDAFCAYLQLALSGALPAHAGTPGYLTKMVRNAARNKRRTHHRARPHDDLDALELPGDEVAADALVAAAEEHVRLRACVDRLCDTQRAIVTLRLFEEQPGEDVAVTLGITRGHVDVLLHRAKASLRACLLE